MDLFGQNRLAALGANHDGVEVLTAVAMLMQERPTAFVDHVSVAPMDDRHHDWIEIEALLRQDVLVALGRFLIGDSAENALPDKLLQALGK
jgi:hypothetical protein